MSFVLLGKRPTGRCYLVSDRVFGSRSEALQELSRITGDPSFAGWDDEIVVLDDTSGSPVLLVRPIEAPEVTGAGHEEREKPSALGDEATAAASEVGDLVTGEIETETIVVETPVVEAAQEPRAEVRDRAPSDLKEVLARTAAQLEAEGVSPPPLVGPSPEPAVAPAAWPWDTDSALARDESGEGGAAVPVSEPDPAEQVVEEPGTEPTAGPSHVSDAGRTGEPLIDPLEEPGYDEEPLIRVSAGADVVEAALSAAGTAVGAGTVEEVLPTSDFVDLSDAPSGELGGVEGPPVSEASADDGIAVERIEEPTGAAAPAVETETPEVAVPTVEDSAPVAASPPLETMTCDDCVYVETCPNSGQRTPASCGSFQWK